MGTKGPRIGDAVLTIVILGGWVVCMLILLKTIEVLYQAVVSRTVSYLNPVAFLALFVFTSMAYLWISFKLGARK